MKRFTFPAFVLPAILFTTLAVTVLSCGQSEEIPGHFEEIAGHTMVKIPGREYYMGKTEVTQAQWEAVMGNNPAYFNDEDNPVESVSWNDCQEFLKKFNEFPAVKESGLVFRLPTEEEWEYACRAGATGKYCKLADGMEITEDAFVRVAWYDVLVGGETHHVGQKEPNAFGLYDMHGNVWEWTQTVDGELWGWEWPPTADGESHVMRGGCYNNSAWDCASLRERYQPDGRLINLGFRLCAEKIQ